MRFPWSSKQECPIFSDLERRVAKLENKESAFPRFFRWHEAIWKFASPRDSPTIFYSINGQLHTCPGNTTLAEIQDIPSAEEVDEQTADALIAKMSIKDFKCISAGPGDLRGLPYMGNPPRCVQYNIGDWIATDKWVGKILNIGCDFYDLEDALDVQTNMPVGWCPQSYVRVKSESIIGLCPPAPLHIPNGYKLLGCSEWHLGDLWCSSDGSACSSEPEWRLCNTYPNYRQRFGNRVWKIALIKKPFIPYQVGTEDGECVGWMHSKVLAQVICRPHSPGTVMPVEVTPKMAWLWDKLRPINGNPNECER